MIRPLISDAMPALYAKIRASWVRGRRSMVKTTSAPSTIAVIRMTAAITFPRKVTPVLTCDASFTWASSSEPAQPHPEVDGASNAQQDEQRSRQLPEQPGGLQHRPRHEGHYDAHQGAHHPGGEIRAQDVPGGRPVATRDQPAQTDPRNELLDIHVV